MAAPAVVRGVPVMDRKIISISSKRQITIPQKFFNFLGFGNEASGEQLLNAFKDTQAKVRPAVKAMLGDAERAASGEGEFATYDAVFGSEG